MKKMLVAIREPVLLDDEKSDTLQTDDGQTVYSEKRFYFHHWGLATEQAHDEKGGVLGISSYTVAVCEDVSTGQVFLLSPESLWIIGFEEYVIKSKT